MIAVGPPRPLERGVNDMKTLWRWAASAVIGAALIFLYVLLFGVLWPWLSEVIRNAPIGWRACLLWIFMACVVWGTWAVADL